MMYKAGAGLNIVRPFIAALYVGFYLLPLTFPLMVRVKPAHRLRMLGVAILGGIAAGYCSEWLIQPGPLNTVLTVAGRLFHHREIFAGLVAVATIYNTMSLGLASSVGAQWSSEGFATPIICVTCDRLFHRRAIRRRRKHPLLRSICHPASSVSWRGCLRTNA